MDFVHPQSLFELLRLHADHFCPPGLKALPEVRSSFSRAWTPRAPSGTSWRPDEFAWRCGIHGNVVSHRSRQLFCVD